MKNKSIWWVDVPSSEFSPGDTDDWPWVNVGDFDSKEKAVQWIRDNIGNCDDDGNICLLTEGQDQ